MVSTGGRMKMLDGPSGQIEYLVTGSGEPVTVFGHGLAGSITTTRPFGSGVAGAKAFFHFRGHGASAAPEDAWTYAALSRELRAVADHVGATQALGVSMGAGAICSLWQKDPTRFDRAVLALPALIDEPRRDRALGRLVEMGQAAAERDADHIRDLLLAEQPEHLRGEPLVRGWCQDQARLLSGTDVSRALTTLPYEVPLRDRRSLRDVHAPVLVLAQEGDDAHPVWVAEELAEALPQARLEVLPPGGIMWSHRRNVRDLVGGFLGDS